MSRSHLVMFTVPTLLVGLWLLADPTPWPGLAATRMIRGLALQVTGVVGIGLMSLGMLLATRPAWLERWLGGLDQAYALHRWLGVGGLALSIAHWATDFLPRRGPKLPRLPVEQMGPVQQAFEAVREVAADAGDLVFKALVVLVALALWRRLPYGRFKQIHWLMAPVYLVLAAHAVVLMRFEYWTTPLGAVMAALLATGTCSAAWVLSGRVGAARRFPGQLSRVAGPDGRGVVELEVTLAGPWPGHAAGQFAFLTLHPGEGPHPYTMTSAWRGDGRLGFAIKALGDYTRTLPGDLRAGSPVTVEGPYGGFTFQDRTPRQIWVGAGIGITPFLARLEALARQPDGKEIVLFHPTASRDEAALSRLEALARQAGVSLRVLWDPRDGQLTAARLTHEVPGWREATVWFCGPSRFGQALHRDLEALGLPRGRFHQERFALR